MVSVNDLLPVHYRRSSSNETKYLYTLCRSNVSIELVQFNFGYAHIREWTDDATSCRDYIKSRFYLIDFRKKGNISYYDYEVII